MSNKKSIPLSLVKYEKDSVPKSLRLNPFLIDIVCFPAEKLFSYNVEALKSFGYKNVITFWDPDCGYIYAEGTMPVCLCAHMDRVYKQDVKKYIPASVVNHKGTVLDTHISSKQGIGGDDRCGVYAILQMLKLGFRPSVLFFMGEERGCLGSHRFCLDFPKDFLSNVNAFIQIDRRGNHDCVRYSDDNEELTKAIEEFDFRFAYGSCSDISVLMPHFGISGVNLSSGYYHEHSGPTEYISVHDLNYLIKRLVKILSSDIFKNKYVYKPRTYSSYYPSYYGSCSPGIRLPSKKDRVEQLSLLKNLPFIEDKIDRCSYCGEPVDADTMVEVLPDHEFICPDCVPDFIAQGYLKCPTCGKLTLKMKDPDDPDFIHDFCEYCGTCLDDEF